jgi:hypothetical protein
MSLLEIFVMETLRFFSRDGKFGSDLWMNYEVFKREEESSKQ